MRFRKSFVVVGMLAVMVAGTTGMADPIPFPLPDPDNDCRWVVCAQCPEGYYLSPTEDDCCRCVPFETF